MLLPGTAGVINLSKEEKERIMEMQGIQMGTLIGEPEAPKRSLFTQKLLNFESRVMQPIFGSSQYKPIVEDSNRGRSGSNEDKGLIDGAERKDSK